MLINVLLKTADWTVYGTLQTTDLTPIFLDLNLDLQVAFGFPLVSFQILFIDRDKHALDWGLQTNRYA